MDDKKKEPVESSESGNGRDDSAGQNLQALQQAPIQLPADGQEPSSPDAVAAPPSNESRNSYSGPKTEKEKHFESLVEKRQAIIDKLKVRNPLVKEYRKKLASMIPQIREKGAGRAVQLMDEIERIEFTISTSAYTPKKEKEHIKRLREIKKELSHHKELEGVRKMVDEERARLRAVVSEIKSLERELADARKECDAAYAGVVAERKAASEQRRRERRGREQKRFDGLRRRAGEDRQREHDSEMKKYLRDYDNTVSIEEICEIERKDRKKE